MDENVELNKIKFLFDKYADRPFHEISETNDVILANTDNVVGEGNVVARVIAFDDPEFLSEKDTLDDLDLDPQALESEFVKYNGKTKEYLSKLYGFVIYKDHKIQILPLTWVSNDKLEFYLYINPTITKGYPSISEIKKLFDLSKIVHCVEDHNINYQVDMIKDDPGKVGGKILIAEGAKPVDGIVEKTELKKSLEHSVGKELEDGRIDYKEKDVFNTVIKGEIIAEKIPMVPATDGVDVYGNTVQGQLKGISPHRLGKNLIPEMEGSNIYVSAMDGVLDICEDGRLNIEERLLVSGDVNLNTGNIRFPGIVEISGNITPGFTVEATKDIYVRGNVEDAIVKSGGKVVVNNGILGKEHCRVEAEGDIVTRFIQNAEVNAGKDIKVTESVVQGKCFAKEYIYVSGRVVGGEHYGRYGITVGLAGAPSETKTQLIAGKDPVLEKRLDELTVSTTEKLNELKSHVDEITQYFGESILSEVKTVMETLPAQRKKQLLGLLQNIKNVNDSVKEMKGERETLKASLNFPKPPFVKVKEEVFLGVTIKIKNAVKKIEQKFESKANFIEDPKTKLIVWE